MACQRTFQLPLDPDSENFPQRGEVPRRNSNVPEDAAWVWGDDDQLGRINLLTPRRVAVAAQLIRSGEVVNLSLRMDVPRHPALGRCAFQHTIHPVVDGVVFDETYMLNTQSSTQWDGFRHFAHHASGLFYNGLRAADIFGDTANGKCGIDRLAEHGIAGRGVLLDYWGYAQSQGKTYDPLTYHAISYNGLVQCGAWQGLDIRPVSQGGDIQVGDILFVRSGYIWANNAPGRPGWNIDSRDTYAASEKEAEHEPKFANAGIKQEEAVIEWLHDCYFAAVAGDSATFEAWPTPEPYYLHEYLLSLFGMPIGELFDLEGLAEMCARTKRWTFFVTSALNNCPGGVASHGNALAIF